MKHWKQITFIFVLAILAIMVITCNRTTGTWVNNEETPTEVIMAADLILPPKIDLTQYIAGNITIDSWRNKSDERIWGWSRTGKIAFSQEYIQRGETEIVNAYMSYIDYFILDLVKDEIVFQCRWDSHGMDYSGEPPQQIFLDMSEKGIERMFNLQKEAISSANMNHDIIYNQGTLLRFPFTHNNLGFYCRANTVYKSENMDTSGFGSNIVQTISSYDIVISRSDGRSKIIYSGSLGTGSYSHWPNMHICGYLRSPYENRIAVIAALEYAGMGESLIFEFHGCHLDIGF